MGMINCKALHSRCHGEFPRRSLYSTSSSPRTPRKRGKDSGAIRHTLDTSSDSSWSVMAFVEPCAGVPESCFEHSMSGVSGSADWEDPLLQMSPTPQAASQTGRGCVWECVCRGPFLENAVGKIYCQQRQAKHLWEVVLGR